MKPNSFVLRIAERDHELDLTQSFVVGDHPSDVELAHAVGAKRIYVLTGHGVKHRAEPAIPDAVAAGIGAPAEASQGTLDIEIRRWD